MRPAVESPLTHSECLFIGGQWVTPASTSTIDVVDSNTEEIYYRVAEAGAPDVARAVTAAREAFDAGPWPIMTHQQRAEYLRSLAGEIRSRADVLAALWPRETGALFRGAKVHAEYSAAILDYYAALADDYPWEESVASTPAGKFGLLVREPVGVVGAIIPWNIPLSLALRKLAPALLAGCTTILKAAPEAPGAAYIIAEAAEAVGLPPGVLNVLTADRDASEALVRDQRVDKISFTGSTVVGRRIASIMADRIGRYTLELGGKSAAIILDDADLNYAATTLAAAECAVSGQVCSSLTRLLVPQNRYNEFVDLIAEAFGAKHVGDAFDDTTDLGPLASAQQRDRVERLIAQGVSEGGKLVTGGRRPPHLEKGYFIEPTVFAGIDNSATIARQENFRTGSHRHPVSRRKRRRRYRERHHLRPQRIRLHPRRRPRSSHRQPTTFRHRGAQRRYSGAQHRLRRFQTVRNRPRRWTPRSFALSRDQDDRPRRAV